MRASLQASFGRLAIQSSSASSSSSRAAIPLAARTSWSRPIATTSTRPALVPRLALAAVASNPRRSYATETTWSLSNVGPLRSKKTAKRLGRGVGSGRGGTSTRGHKGQKARRGNGKPVPGFAGGQAPLIRTTPKRGFTNAFAHETVPLNIGRLQRFINNGRLDASKPITVRELYLSGCIHQVGTGGVKLLAQASEALESPIDIVVSRASASAIRAIEAQGGTITCKFYTPLSLRAAIKPEKWLDRGRIVPEEPLPLGRRDLMYYTDISKRGYLAKMNRNGTLDSVLKRLDGASAQALLNASVAADKTSAQAGVKAKVAEAANEAATSSQPLPSSSS